MEIQYNEYKPNPLLQDYVDAYFAFSYFDPEGKDAPVQRCMPHGMAGLIIHVGGARSYFIDGSQSFLHPEAYFVGIIKETAYWGMPSGSASFGVRFKPEGLVRLFSEPLSGTFNGYVDADVFFNRKLSSVIHQVQDAATDRERIFLVESYLHNRLKSIRSERNYLADSLHIIRASQHDLSMKQLSDMVCVGERQLQRSFKTLLGLSPKYYQRINRFSKAFQLTESGSGPWTSIAYQAGYADQAHFIRDFKEFAGDSPRRFFAGPDH